MSIKLKDTIYDLVNKSSSSTKATQDGSGNTITSTYLKLSGGTMTGPLTMGQYDLNFKGSDPGDIVWQDADGKETHRIWNNSGVLNYRKDAGTAYTILHSGNYSTWAATKDHTHSGYASSSHTHTKSQITDFSHSHNYAGSDSAGGAANSSKLLECRAFTNASDITFDSVFWTANGSCSDVSSMGYAAVMNVGSGLFRGWQIWNSRNDHKLYWRPALSDGSAWGSTIHILLDNQNFSTWAAPKDHTHSYAASSHTHTKSQITDFSHTHSYAGSSSAGGAATSANWLNSNSRLSYGDDGLNYFNISGTAGNTKSNNTPKSDWYHILRMNHGNSAGYFADIATPLNDVNGVYWRQVRAGSFYGWFRFLDSNNYTEFAATKDHTHNYAGSSSAGGSATSANTAAQLTTARTIWGQSFNGTGNVDGTLTINHNSQADGTFAFIINRNNNGDTISIRNTSSATNTYIRGSASFPNRTKTNGMGWHVFPAESLYTNGLGNTGSSYNINGCTVTFGGWNDTAMAMYIDTEGKKVGIGTVKPSSALTVIGTTRSTEIQLTGQGTGTYNIASITQQGSGLGLQLEGALSSDSSSASRLPITLSWRGGYNNKGGLQITDSSVATLGGYKIWHEGNDGSGSTLDADKLDGLDSTEFPRAGAHDGPVNFNSFTNRSYIGSLYVNKNSPTSSTDVWFNTIQIAHRNGEGDGSSYIGQIAIGMTGYKNRMWFRGSRTESWIETITSSNIGSQSVNYATSAGNANTVDGYHISVGSSAGSDANTIYYIV